MVLVLTVCCIITFIAFIVALSLSTPRLAVGASGYEWWHMNISAGWVDMTVQFSEGLSCDAYVHLICLPH